MVQKRIDIEDGTAYTWKSLFKHYKKTYDYLDVVEYWKGLAIYTPPIPDHPPVDGAGEWVERRNFDGEKSFGFFICDCGRYWLTAHCYRDYKQGCKWCEKESLSYYMWENHETDKRPRRAKRYGDKPHDEQRCEAGRRGKCDSWICIRTRSLKMSGRAE